MVHSRQPPFVKGQLVRRIHTAPDGQPYYDAELDLSHSRAHGRMVTDLAGILWSVARRTGHELLSDNSIWYADPHTGEQVVRFPDLALALDCDVQRMVVDDVLFVGEVVSTHDRRKEHKDTYTQKILNEYNQVPEFALFFPEIEDPRSLIYYKLEGSSYQELQLSPGAEICSQSFPGLCFRVYPHSEWEAGYKVGVWFNDELQRSAHEANALARSERVRATHAEAQAEHAESRAEHAESRAEHAESRAEHAEAQVEAAKQAQDQALRKANRLIQKLKALGIDPSGISSEGEEG